MYNFPGGLEKGVGMLHTPIKAVGSIALHIPYSLFLDSRRHIPPPPPHHPSLYPVRTPEISSMNKSQCRGRSSMGF